MTGADEDGHEGWRRAALSYREKFVDDLIISLPDRDADGMPPLRIAQAPSAPSAVGTSHGAGQPSSSSPPPPGDPDDTSVDPIPATGFTVWDAGILLGMYVTQPEVWRRLSSAADDGAADDESPSVSSGRTDSCEQRSVVVLELGSGTGVAGLLVASSGLPAVVGMSDLPGLVPFIRANASRNKAPVGPVPDAVAMAAVPLRWGVDADVRALPRPLRAPHLVLGADLIYTEKREVIDALVATLCAIVPVGGVAVMASCRDHRPESVDYFEERVAAVGGFRCDAVNHGALRPGYGRESGGVFRVIELRREGGKGTS